MGVYIPNIEMPRSCIACHLNFGEKRPEYGLTICCPYSDGVISWRDKAFNNGRLTSCEIVPVSPHGRMGDLDELAKRIEYDRYHHTHTDGLAARHHIAEYGHFLNAIAAAPTIIPAELPVLHETFAATSEQEALKRIASAEEGE